MGEKNPDFQKLKSPKRPAGPGGPQQPYLHQAGQDVSGVLPGLVVDLRGELDDLAGDVAPQVAAGLQHQCPRPHQQVAELLRRHGAALLLRGEDLDF